jgi:hypothetical protein
MRELEISSSSQFDELENRKDISRNSSSESGLGLGKDNKLKKRKAWIESEKEISVETNNIFGGSSLPSQQRRFE